jgi:dTDP-4-dehydrorhamnose 3,5-epimerase
MRVFETKLDGVLIIEPTVHEDERGSFFELWNSRRYAELSIRGPFVQDNVSTSKRGVLRGLHFQNPIRRGSSSAC